MKHLVLIAALLVAPAHAAFKCTAPDGSVTLQQMPCAQGEVSAALALPPPQYADRPEYIRQALAERAIVAGMTRREVDAVMRVDANAATRSVYNGRVSLQLVYRQPRRTIYVYLDDGVVTSTSETQR